MPTKFSQFLPGGNLRAGDIVVGLRNGQDTQFDAPALPLIAWSNLTVGQPLAINEGYLLTNPIAATYTLPAVAAFGQILQIYIGSTAPTRIGQNAGQQIIMGSIVTTAGAAGYIESTHLGDSIYLVCISANTVFGTLGGPQGNWTIV